jgi:hypothetical protein
MRLLRLMLSRHLDRHFDGSGDALFRRCGYRPSGGGRERRKHTFSLDGSEWKSIRWLARCSACGWAQRECWTQAVRRLGTQAEGEPVHGGEPD